MRTIYATGGYTGTLQADLGGADLTGATYKLALVPEGVVDPPAAGDALWKTATTDPAAPTAPKVTVPASQTPGHFRAWVQVTIGSTIIPVRIMDPDDPSRPLLVHVV